jgi:hypothetical protein
MPDSSSRLIFRTLVCFVLVSPFFNLITCNSYSPLSVRWREWAKKGKDSKIPVKKDDSGRIEKLKQAEVAAEELKRKAKTTEEKLHAAQAVEKAKAASKEV